MYLESLNKLKSSYFVGHSGRGKFKILNNEYGIKYVNRIVDASDIVHCKVVDN
jgi:hypothetical protein